MKCRICPCRVENSNEIDGYQPNGCFYGKKRKESSQNCWGGQKNSYMGQKQPFIFFIGVNMVYFRFKDNFHSWVLPVYEDSFMFKNPDACFSWDKSIKFVGEVTRAEYDEQFKPAPVQLELFQGDI